MSTTTSTQWRAVGLAVREHDAIRLELLEGGAYFIAAADVPDALDLETVPLYQLRTRAGERIPVEAGHVRTSSSGRMIVCQLEDPAPAIVMIPRIALLDHYTDASGRPTRIVVPPDPATGPARGLASPSAVTA